MAYEQLIKEFKKAKPIGNSDLDIQPRYAAIALFLSLLLITSALITANSKKSFPLKFITYTFLSAGGSLFFGLGAIYLANSVGVYI
ncbi:hypothetical protein HG535_0G04760 [Zygotorulaspora mrakii]|uniref:Dolichyl-diphosphooligosaccharide-protein glycosyltransferase subunit OST5 n=1 Tax=Zygotorulaspora mrakii TaxID=42260 RepID=A0A7H9B7W4_ZYGMR|nr:uncharacterized protein HG535_0G04760 [Zygotorulaspora mrakii]QLG74593.1 hypothetical protein HG535_0G04760 [Zygotorulaspora mrakii]